MKFSGSYVALVTPFHADGSVNFDKLKELVNWQITQGTDGIVALGTTGESSTMTHEEDDEVARCVIETVNGRIPVICGAGSNCTKTQLEKSRRYCEMGADGLLLITPYYNKANDEGMYRHFATVADSVDAPIILYNVPGRTGCSISPACCARLAAHPNIAGIKEASGNIGYTARIAHLVGEDFCMFSGNDDMIVPVMSLGGCGVISVLANVCPAQTHELVASFAAGDVAHARALQLRYLDLIDALFCEVNPIPVKEAMNQLGMEVGGYRLPLCEISAAGRERVRRALEVLA
ncbi:MAG TPA: 4-hydroxy-tetrahydrodipicolinate synthase [Candidatus Ventricola gallistercoris]|nr:4-hydroxy-tetrahydrodipicolinate synthase [Candidatus Ventricola gallistercoris]